jgi:O-antigen ligase
VHVVSLAAASGVEGSQRRFAISTVLSLQVALLLLVVGNLGRIPVLDLGERAAPLLVNDIAVAAVLCIGVFAMMQARSLRLNDVATAGIIFAAIGGLSAIAGVQRFGFSALEVVGSLAYLARWCLYFGLYIAIINCVRARDAESVWSALETAMLVIVAFGIVQAIFLPNFAFIVYPDARVQYDWDAQRHRLVSTILEPNIASGMILTVLLVQLARLSTGARVPLWKPTMMFAGLVATLSRGGMLAFVIGACVLLAIRGLSKRVLKFGTLMVVLLVPAMPLLLRFANQYTRFSVSDESAMTRVLVWQRALATFVEYPWFGIGFNTYGFVQERRGFERVGGSSYSAEGGLLFVAVLTGIVGLLVYMGMLWFVLRRSRRGWKNPSATPGERGLLIGTYAATLAILVHSIFVNSLLTPWVMEPLLVLWGLAFVTASELRHRRVTAGI